MTDGDAARIIAACGLLEALEKAFLRGHFRQFGIIGNCHLPSGRAGGLIALNRHCGFTLLIIIRGIMRVPILCFKTSSPQKGKPAYIMLSKNSMPLELAFKVTIAFLRSDL